MKNCILFLNWFQVLHHLLYTRYNLVITSILSSSEKINWIKISCFQRKRKMDWRYLSKYKWRHNSSVKSAALSSSRYINSFLLFLVSLQRILFLFSISFYVLHFHSQTNFCLTNRLSYFSLISLFFLPYLAYRIIIVVESED